MYILYDGDCGACNRFVQFLTKKDTKKKLTFSPLSGNIGQSILEKAKMDLTYNQSIVLYHNGRIILKSDAIIHILNQLGKSYKLCAILLNLIPLRIRDRIYDKTAVNRYLFGKTDSCFLNISNE